MRDSRFEIWRELLGSTWIALCLIGVVVVVICTMPVLLWKLSRIGKA